MSYKILTEGKHWPEDYIKTAYNTIKNSPLGQQSWYTDEYLIRDLIGPPINPNTLTQDPVHDINRIDKFDLAHNANKYGILGDFSPLMHKNSNLGFFATIIRWFINYSGTSKEKYQEFIERKLDGIIGTLQFILNDPSYDKIRDEIKTKWTLQQFEELQKKIADEAKASSDEKMKNIQKRDDYKVIPIYSYEELHKKFGGDWTGWHGQSEWCHTNGKSTYENWTKDGTQMFFVLAKKDWKKIKPKNPNATSAYDEYGLSLIAILVDVVSGKLLNETLRWNHIIEPGHTNPGASVDKAFKNNWGELSQAIGMNVKAACEKECKRLKAKLEKLAKTANEEAEKILSQVDEIDDDTIPEKIKKHITSIVIPSNVTSIGMYAFSDCRSLKSVTIPDSVTSIERGTFKGCTGFKSVTIPDSVTRIGNVAFYGCKGLMSVTIPDSVMSIGDQAFCKCSSLTNVIISNSMISIGDGAFRFCSGLTSVTIPNSVTSIGSYAFIMCSNLMSITFEGKTLEEVKAMENYPFGIEDEIIIKCEDSIDESCIDELDMLFESCNVATGRQPSSIQHGERYDEVNKGDFAYDAVRRCLREGMILGGVWQVDNKYYVASIFGGNNNNAMSRKIWVSYLQEVEQMISQMLESGCGSIWLISFTNDPLDDAWELRIGFDLLSSPFKDDN